jgi:uncharacterized protein YndB with AHSA1/START domain
MTQGCVTHSTFIIERNLASSPERVFAAWSDPVQKRRWYAEGERGSVEAHHLDFRVGGSEHTTTIIGGGPFKGTALTNDSQATVEFLADGKGTIMAFTEQSAFFEGADGAEMREQGWKSLVGQLEKFLAR